MLSITLRRLFLALALVGLSASMAEASAVDTPALVARAAGTAAPTAHSIQAAQLNTDYGYVDCIPPGFSR